MELGYLIQFILLGQVVSDSGVTRKVGNSWVYRVTGTAPAVVDKAAYYNALVNVLFQPFVLLLSVAYVQGQVFVLYPNTPGDTALGMGAAFTGGYALPRLSLNCAAYINLKGARRGRFFIGSKRVGPLARSVVAGDELTNSYLTSVVNALQTWTNTVNVNIAGGGVNVLTPVIWSRRLSANDTTVPPGVGTDLILAHVNQTVSTWRHRRERVVR